MISKPYTNSCCSTLCHAPLTAINWGSNKSIHFHRVTGLVSLEQLFKFKVILHRTPHPTHGSMMLCDRASLFYIIISLLIPFYSQGSIPAIDLCFMKGYKRVTCWSGCLCGALSCWGQQVGFLPSRDDAFYNEEVKEIIMEINFWTALACELYQAEL